MNKNKYKALVNRHTPKENTFYNGIIAFIIGGLTGMFGQFLIEIYSYYLEIPTKQASVFMIITLVFLGCLLTAVGILDKIISFARCGLIIPITGFAHSMMSAAMEYRKEGLVTGIGANMFKLAGSVIIFGVVSSYIMGILRYMVGG
jgi:SpoVA protein.